MYHELNFFIYSKRRLLHYFHLNTKYLKADNKGENVNHEAIGEMYGEKHGLDH